MFLCVLIGGPTTITRLTMPPGKDGNRFQEKARTSWGLESGESSLIPTIPAWRIGTSAK